MEAKSFGEDPRTLETSFAIFLTIRLIKQSNTLADVVVVVVVSLLIQPNLECIQTMKGTAQAIEV